MSLELHPLTREVWYVLSRALGWRPIAYSHGPWYELNGYTMRMLDMDEIELFELGLDASVRVAIEEARNLDKAGIVDDAVPRQRHKPAICGPYECCLSAGGIDGPCVDCPDASR